MSERLNMKYDYPENLLMATFQSYKPEKYQIKDIVYDREKLASIEYVLDSELTEREADIIRKYFKEKMIYQEIGDAYNLSHDRIRQILMHALRKLRHPSRSGIIFLGVKGYYKKHYNTIISDIADKYHVTTTKTEVSEPVIAFTTSIEELELSVRSFNSLVRANKRTVWSLYLSTDYEMLNNTRNFGRKSFDEVTDKIRTMFGFEFANNNNLEAYKKRLSLIKSLNLIGDREEAILLNKFYENHDKIVTDKIDRRDKLIKSINKNLMLLASDFDGDIKFDKLS